MIDDRITQALAEAHQWLKAAENKAAEAKEFARVENGLDRSIVKDAMKAMNSACYAFLRAVRRDNELAMEAVRGAMQKDGTLQMNHLPHSPNPDVGGN